MEINIIIITITTNRCCHNSLSLNCADCFAPPRKFGLSIRKNLIDYSLNDMKNTFQSCWSRSSSFIPAWYCSN